MFCVRAFPYYLESSLVVLRCTLINVSAILFTVIYGNKLLDVITHILRPHRMNRIDAAYCCRRSSVIFVCVCVCVRACVRACVRVCVEQVEHRSQWNLSWSKRLLQTLSNAFLQCRLCSKVQQWASSWCSMGHANH